MSIINKFTTIKIINNLKYFNIFVFLSVLTKQIHAK
jgi:hypothetical protein